MKKLLLAAATIALTGCSSIVSESNYPVSVQSSPAGASYEITNETGMVVSSGVTPGQVTLKAGAGYFDGELYRITYKKDGYEDQISMLDSELDNWYWGNIIFGGLIGMLIVDPATGAMYKLPSSAHGTLAPVPTPIASTEGAEIAQ
ncbi:hypothetical protein NA647_15050 [Pseudomonas stutzeri]|uniref:hypothetical protein n=1 Tax=Stutzerimonas stutzeri TaxID=316 RepID=UPI00210D583C|nr:hypothetical protein [Stutzerimonas stutzeri]MCQ4288746.1 hypothetical protein [Stutzerimonas stutzeri]